MSDETPKHGLLQYWPQITMMVGIVFYIGVAYGDSNAMKARLSSLEDRVQRQYTSNGEINKQMVEIKEDLSYIKGYQQAAKDFTNSK